MTVSSETTRRATLAGNGVAVDIAISFVFLDEEHLVVTEYVTATEVETELTITTDYTVTHNVDGTGTVHMNSAPATGTTITVTCDTPITQETDYTDGDSFPAESHENALDKITYIVQEQQEVLDRCLKNEVSDPTAITWSDITDARDAAAASAAAALASEVDAETAAAAAGVSETNAAASETAAGLSETAAAASAAAALISENAAAASETAAGLSETAAAASAAAALISENAAAASETAAGLSETAAAASAAAALISENAAESAKDDAETAAAAAIAAAMTSQVNLVRNPFGAMSQGTMVNHPDASDLISNGGFDSDTTGWAAGNSATLSSEAGGQSGNCLKILENGGANPRAEQSFTTVIGRIYTIVFYVKQGDEATWLAYVDKDGFGGNDLGQDGGEATGSWVQHSITFKAQTTTTYLTLLQVCGAAAGTYILFDTITCYEQTRACTGADTKCFDLWGKDATLDVYRVVAKDVFTNAKEMYGAKLVPTAQNDYFQFINGDKDGIPWIARMAGNAVTIQARVVSSTAGDIRLRAVDDGDGGHISYSAYHTGGGAEEVLELTFTPHIDSTIIYFGVIHSNATPGAAYITDFQISFGSHIGDGNYVPPPPHSVTLEAGISSQLTGNGYSDVSETSLDVEVDSEMGIPVTADAIQALMAVRDSGSAGTDCYLRFRPYNGGPQAFNRAHGLANDAYSTVQRKVVLVDGVTDYNIVATGVGTFDVALVTWERCYFN